MEFVQARNYKRTDGRDIRLIVLHSMESPEKPGTAKAVAAWFAGPSAPVASAHYCVDGRDVVQCVREQDVAYAAPGANHDGLQIEIAGRASQTASEWVDPPGILDNASTLVARLCRKYGLPARFLSPAEVAAGLKGVTTHANVTKAYPGPGRTHWDPGTGFPVSRFMRDVRRKMNPSPARVVLMVAGEPAGYGFLHKHPFVQRVANALVADGARPAFTATVDGKPVARGRLWPFIRPFNRKVNRLVREGHVVRLSDHVTLRLEQ